jgi:hypothetical protein
LDINGIYLSAVFPNTLKSGDKSGAALNRLSLKAFYKPLLSKKYFSNVFFDTIYAYYKKDTAAYGKNLKFVKRLST